MLEPIHHFRRQIGHHARKGPFQHGAEGFQLHAVFRHEAAHARRIGRVDLRHFRFHARQIGRRFNGNGVGTFEDQPILRIKADQIHLILKPRATGFEDFRQDARIQEESRPNIKAVAAGRRYGAGAPAHHGILFEYRDAHAGGGQQHGRGQASGAGADHGNMGASL